MFQLTKDECLGSQIATLNEGPSQIPYFPTGRPCGGFSLTLTNTACPTRPYYVTRFQKINANTLISENQCKYVVSENQCKCVDFGKSMQIR